MKSLAKEFGRYFLPLRETFELKAEEFGAEYYLADGVHPNIAGAHLIADRWMELVDKEIDSSKKCCLTGGRV